MGVDFPSVLESSGGICRLSLVSALHQNRCQIIELTLGTATSSSQFVPL